jgi:hypothetical protein
MGCWPRPTSPWRPAASTATVRSGFVEVCGDRVVILSDPDEEGKAEEEKGGTS